MRKAYTPVWKLFDNFEAVFFNHRIGENLFGDALELFLSLLTVPAIQIQDEKFPLANIFYLRIAQSRQGVVNGLPLRIQHGSLRHYPNMCFHANSITFLRTALGWPPVQPATNPAPNAVGFSSAAGSEAVCSARLPTEMNAQIPAPQVWPTLSP